MKSGSIFPEFRQGSLGFSRLVFAIVAAVAVNSARCDLSALGVTGPHSGAGFSNLGAITKEPVSTVMANAEVLIEVQRLDGADLVATCTATFEFDSAGAGVDQNILVAFPVTGLGNDAVNISQFEVSVDGVPKRGIEGRWIQLYSGSVAPSPHMNLPQVEAAPDTSEYFGFQRRSGDPNPATFVSAFAWSQLFTAAKPCRIEIKYLLTIHLQSLAYAKRYLHDQSPNVIPFDAMWAGASDEKAFFLDYILRSGATWKGPIGHERVTLVAAPSSGLEISYEEVITFGRHVFVASQDLREGLARIRAGVGANGVRRAKGIVWEVHNEDPREDILVQIPESAVKSTGSPGAK